MLALGLLLMASACQQKPKHLVPELKYSQDFSLAKAAGSYKITVSTGSERYDVSIDLTVPKTILPADFIWNPKTAEKFAAADTRLPALDFLQFFIYPSTGNAAAALGVDVGVGVDSEDKTIDEFSGHLYLEARTVPELLAAFKKTDRLRISRYNAREVGLKPMDAGAKDNQTSWSYALNADKAFDLHPPLADEAIAWDQVAKDLGLQP